MGKVNRRQGQAFALDVLPNVHFRPIGNREHAHVFAFEQTGVIKAPQFWALCFRVPLAKFIAEREDAFFGAGFFFIATRAAHQGIKFMVFNRFKQGHGLGGIARIQFASEHHRAFFNRIFHMAHHQLHAQAFYRLVTKSYDFLVVVAGVHVQQFKRQLQLALAIAEGFACQGQQHHRVFAARKQQGGILGLSNHLADDVNRLGFQPIQMFVTDCITHVCFFIQV